MAFPPKPDLLVKLLKEELCVTSEIKVVSSDEACSETLNSKDDLSTLVENMLFE